MGSPTLFQTLKQKRNTTSQGHGHHSMLTEHAFFRHLPFLWKFHIYLFPVVYIYAAREKLTNMCGSCVKGDQVRAMNVTFFFFGGTHMCAYVHMISDCSLHYIMLYVLVVAFSVGVVTDVVTNAHQGAIAGLAALASGVWCEDGSLWSCVP
jgi:hypothetical protein